MMKTKTLIALTCVMMMALCPMACLASDTDAADDHESTVMVTFDNLSEKGVYDVFDYSTYTNMVAKNIWNNIYMPLCLNDNLFNNANVTFTVSDFKYQSGESNKFVGEKEQSKRAFAKISCNFDLKLEMKNTAEMSLLYQYTSNSYTGEAIEQMVKEFGKTTVEYGDFIEVKGSYSFEQTMEEVYSDIVKVDNDSYYYKKDKTVANNKLDFDVKVMINDKIIDDKMQQTAKSSRTITYDIVNGEGKDYESESMQAANYDISSSIDSTGTKKINGKVYGYDANDAYLINDRYGPVMQKGPALSDMKDESKYGDLAIFNAYKYASQPRSDSDITEKVQAYNGTTTKNVSDFDKAYNKISGDFNNGQSDDNTAWIVVVILVVLVIVAFIIYYLLNRMKPKTDAQEQPKGPEQQ